MLTFATIINDHKQQIKSSVNFGLDDMFKSTLECMQRKCQV